MMRWGARKQQHGTPCAQEQGGESARKSKSKGMGIKAFSFSPLSWLAKLITPKPNASPKHAPAAQACVPGENGEAGAGAAPVLPSSVPKRTSPVLVPRQSMSVPPHRSPAEVVPLPRRLSVSNDNADAVAAHRHCILRRRHCSLGGDSDLHPSLGQLIHFSLAGSTARSPPQAAAAPSDTDAGVHQLRRRRHRAHHHHRRSLSGSRRSFSISGRMPLPIRVRVRARRAPELERFAVVRRTRDPQRAFRESMAEMFASRSGDAAAAARPKELERLLACYLSLNADEHHDCIVKVFRQVCFEHVNLLPRPAHSGRPAGQR